MYKMTKHKKIFFVFIFIFIVIRIIYIGARGEINKEYYTARSFDLSSVEEIPCQNISVLFRKDSNQLNSLELIFDHISADETGTVTLGIWSDKSLIYQTNLSLNNINNWKWKKIYVNATLQSDEEYEITLNANDDCVQIPTVFVVKNDLHESTSLYCGDTKINGNLVMKFGYLRSPGIFDRLSVISVWILFIVGAYVFLFYWDKFLFSIQKIYCYMLTMVHESVLIAIAEILAAIIIINNSGIEFQEATKIIIYVISLISVLNHNSKIVYINKLAGSPVKKILLYLLYIYAAFALVGQRILIYPLTLKVTAGGLFVFAITIMWFVPIINSLLYFLDYAGNTVCGNKVQMKTLKFIVVCSLILIVPAIYNLFANNPGISSRDTYTSMIVNAQHLHGMYDWHPAFYCMVLRVIQSISNSTYAVISVQYFFWIYVMIELLLYLRKKGMKDCVLICAAIFSGFNASNFIHINTIWKDIPYTLSLLWVFIILARLSIDYDEYMKKWYIYLELIVSLLGVCLYRKNGIISFIIIVLASIIVLRKNVKVWISIVITIVFIFTIKGPVYNHFQIENPGKYGMYIGLGQDVLGVYYAGGEVSEETLQMITMMTEYNIAEYSYTPTWSQASYDVDIEPIAFIANYLDTFIKNPVVMIRAIIDREDALWDIYLGKDSILDCVNFYDTIDSNEIWNQYYPARRYVSLYTEMSAATDYTAATQWIAAIIWRCGLFTLVGLSAIVFIIFKKGVKKHLLILFPIVGHTMSLLLSTGWSDFRYFWPMNLMNMALILIVMVINQNSKSEKQ